MGRTARRLCTGRGRGHSHRDMDGMQLFQHCPRAIRQILETGLFVAGIFGEIKPGITDFVNLPTPAWGNIECDGHPITLSSPVSSTLDMKTGVRSQSFLAQSGETTLNIEHQVFCSMSDPSLLVQRLSLQGRSRLLSPSQRRWTNSGRTAFPARRRGRFGCNSRSCRPSCQGRWQQ